jgi:hypothetical protein
MRKRGNGSPRFSARTGSESPGYGAEESDLPDGASHERLQRVLTAGTAEPRLPVSL